jgi:hypothetical protein
LSLLRSQPCFIPQQRYMSWKPVAHDVIVLEFFTSVKHHTCRRLPSLRSENQTGWGLMLSALEGIAIHLSPDQPKLAAYLPEGERLDLVIRSGEYA